MKGEEGVTHREGKQLDVDAVLDALLPVLLQGLLARLQGARSPMPGTGLTWPVRTEQCCLSVLCSTQQALSCTEIHFLLPPPLCTVLHCHRHTCVIKNDPYPRRIGLRRIVCDLEREGCEGYLCVEA